MNFDTGGLRDMILEMTDDTDEQDFYTTMYVHERYSFSLCVSLRVLISPESSSH
jgi:hypothetical protein